MANNYQSWSFTIEGLNKEQADWIDERLKMGSDYSNSPDKIEQAKIETQATAEGWWNEELEYAGFCQWQRDGDELTLYSEYGNIEMVADLLRAFTRQFDFPDVIGWEWADTCDKLRPGEFGGGAVAVYKGEAHYQTTSGWLEAKAKELVGA